MPFDAASPVRGGTALEMIEDQGGRMPDDVDLTKLTAEELVAYGEQAGWTTDEVREALTYRMMLRELDSSHASLRQTLNDPTVLRAIKLCEEHPPTKEPRGWFASLWDRLFSQL